MKLTLTITRVRAVGPVTEPPKEVRVGEEIGLGVAILDVRRVQVPY